MAFFRFVVIGLAMLYLLIELLDLMFGLAEILEDHQHAHHRTVSSTAGHQAHDDRNREKGPQSPAERRSGTGQSNRQQQQQQQQGTVKGKGRGYGATEGNKATFAVSQALLWAVDGALVDDVQTLLKSPRLDVNHANEDGSALYRLANHEEGETEDRKKIFEMLLANSKIHVNGDDRLPPPLKVALAKGHHWQVKKLLSHPKIHSYITASSLPCTVLMSVPSRITFILDYDSPEKVKACFGNHRSTISAAEYRRKFGDGPRMKTVDRFEAGSKAERAAAEVQQKATAAGSSAPVKGAGGGTTLNGRVGEFGIDSIVMNPAYFPSLFSALWTYCFGDNVQPTMLFVWLVSVALFGGLLIVGLCMTVAVDQREKQQAKEDAEKAEKEKEAAETRRRLREAQEEAEAVAAAADR